MRTETDLLYAVGKEDESAPALEEQRTTLDTDVKTLKKAAETVTTEEELDAIQAELAQRVDAFGAKVRERKLTQIRMGAMVKIILKDDPHTGGIGIVHGWNSDKSIITVDMANNNYCEYNIADLELYESELTDETRL